jgi:hypothetical protein
LQHSAKRKASQKGKRNAQRGVDEAAAAGFEHFVQIHSEA